MPGAAQEAAAAAARAASRPPGCGRSARGLGAEPGVIPGAGRGRSGGRSEGRPAARAPCCRLPAAALLLAGAPPGAAPGAPLRLPPRAESLRAQLSLLAVRGSRRVFSVRGSQLSHCAPARPIQAVLFLPALSLRGRKQTRQRSEAPVHTCAGGRCQALLHLPNSHRSNSVTPPERHLVPRAPRGALPPGSPLLPMRNLMQTHFDHGFLAGLDLPTERF